MSAVNLYGQAIGRKGVETRSRIMSCYLEQLKETSHYNIRIASLCSFADVSMGTFYKYFKDLDGLAYEAVRLQQVIPDSVWSVFKEDWTAENAFQNGCDLCERYLAYWSDNYHILNLRNQMADAGDLVMKEIRYESVVPLLYKIVDLISEARSSRLDFHGVNPYAAATIILSSIERMATIGRAYVDNVGMLNMDDIIKAESYTLLSFMFVGGADLC